jgi:formylglycine-generating enzyme required for sulfatase activity/serine/threonine protein kinase
MENQSIRDPYKLVGTNLKRYQIQGLVGIGGMGAVYRAQHEITKAVVAVKVLRPDLWMGDQESLSYFFAEATKTCALNHPSIIKVNDADITEDGLAFMVMDLLDGRTIETELKEMGVVPLERVNALLELICDAVAYAHTKNVVHRDLKPGNIMLVTEENGEESLRILDFGIAKILSASSRTNTRIFGSSYYVSPEQTMANGRIDRSTDIYSLGVTLYEMLTGRVPFEGETEAQVIDMHRSQAPRPLREHRPEIPQAVEDVVLRAMAKNPQDRFQSAILLARAFQKAVNFAPGALELRCIDLDSGEDISSAMIYLNGRLAGQAQDGSWRQDNLIPRKYLIEVEAPSYINWHRSVTLDSHEKLALVVELEHEQAPSLPVEVASDTVEIDGLAVGNTAAFELTSHESIATTEVGTFPPAFIDKPEGETVHDFQNEVIEFVSLHPVSSLPEEELKGEHQKAEIHVLSSRADAPVNINVAAVNEIRNEIKIDAINGKNDGPRRVQIDLNPILDEHLPEQHPGTVKPPSIMKLPPLQDPNPIPLRQRAHKLVLVVGVGLFIFAAYAFLTWLLFNNRTQKESIEIITLLPNCKVLLDDKAEYITDDQGKITISGLESGAHTIKVSKPGYSDITQTITIPLDQPLQALVPGIIIPENMAFIPGGAFTMGRGNASPENASGPAHQVNVAPFFMDKHEVTRAEYQKFIKATGHRAPSVWKNGTFPNGTGEWPVTGVSWEDAQRYAKWAGKRLPTEAEWEFAARGFDKRIYPWGNKFSPDKANIARETAQFTKAENYPKGVSPFGVFDLAGNAWEWTDSDYTPYPGSAFKIVGCNRCKVLRGGSFVNRPEYATATYRLAYEATLIAEPNLYYGFRCALSATSP